MIHMVIRLFMANAFILLPIRLDHDVIAHMRRSNALVAPSVSVPMDIT